MKIANNSNIRTMKTLNNTKSFQRLDHTMLKGITGGTRDKGGRDGHDNLDPVPRS